MKPEIQTKYLINMTKRLSFHDRRRETESTPRQYDSLEDYPSNTTSIRLNGEKITYMPSFARFTDHLINVNLRNNRIRELPPVWANSIEIIDVSNNEIQVIRSLPTNLLWFGCSNNQITTVCPLPKKTRVFLCNHNQINELPPLSQALVHLYASNNRIRKLPPLPEGLSVLDCSHNRIQSFDAPLPELLLTLNCEQNPMTMVPRVPLYLNNVYMNDAFMALFQRVPDDIASTISAKINYTHDVLMAFKMSYYCMRFRRSLRDALWRIRELQAMKDMHPSVICRMLDEGIDPDDIYISLVGN